MSQQSPGTADTDLSRSPVTADSGLSRSLDTDRDSGIVRSNSAYGQTATDDELDCEVADAGECDGLMTVDDERTSIELTRTPANHSSQPLQDADRLPAVDDVERSHNVERSRGTENSATKEEVNIDDVDSMVTAKDIGCLHDGQTTTTNTTRSSSTMDQSTTTLSPDLHTGETDESSAVTWLSEMSMSEDQSSAGEHRPLTQTTTTSKTARSSSTSPGRVERSPTSFMASTTEDPCPTLEKVTVHRTESTARVETAVSSCSSLVNRDSQGTSESSAHVTKKSSVSRDLPRRRVVNPEFLTSTLTSRRPRKPPMFIRKMRSMSVLEGQTARFDVLVDGNPTPSVSWIKNGVELVIDGRKYSVEASKEEEGRWSLLVFSCSESDQAEYGCSAVSGLDKITSRCQLDIVQSRQ